MAGPRRQGPGGIKWARVRRPNKYSGHKPSSEKNSAGQRRVRRGLKGDA